MGCKAQTYPLNTYYGDVPEYSYMKDLDNVLSPYVGIYKATYNGNETTLYITKEEKMLKVNSLNKKYFKDVLHIKYTVKNISTGAILQDTQNVNTQDNKITSIGTLVFDNNAIDLIHYGAGCGLGGGDIKLKKPSANQISWTFSPESTMMLPGQCPNVDRKIYLPEAANLIFTKQ
ncbi:hypothetical protein J2X97_002312 [Epilithonimonas hungarica]|nr:hypothetical protein [Epilithonimonas hungarica]